MSNKRKILIFLILLSIPFLAELSMSLSAKSTHFHSDLELTQFGMMSDSLFGDYNSLFAASGECIQCHDSDTTGITSITLLREDINLVDDSWASMMANFAKDSFWRAKMSHEIILYPQHQQTIENKCTSCHAPLGHFAAMHDGQEYYSMVEIYPFY